MFLRKGTGAPWRERGGLVSRILPQEGDVPGVGRTATWVEVAPGSCRRLRDHVAEQAHVIPRDRGKTRAGEEERRVEEGDLVCVPPGASYGNAPEGALVYVATATPAHNAEADYDTGRLRKRHGDREGGGRAHG